MTHSSRLIEMQAEHIEALEAELADLDARLGRKTRRDYADPFSIRHKSPDAILRAQKKLTEQLESDLVAGYADLGEKYKRKRGKRQKSPGADPAPGASFRTAVGLGASLLDWYVFEPARLEAYTRTHSRPRRERDFRYAALVALHSPMLLGVLVFLLSGTVIPVFAPVRIFVGIDALALLALQAFGSATFSGTPKWPYPAATILGGLFTAFLFSPTLFVTGANLSMRAVFFPASVALVGIFNAGILHNLAVTMFDLDVDEGFSYKAEAFGIAHLYGAVVTSSVVWVVCYDGGVTGPQAMLTSLAALVMYVPQGTLGMAGIALFTGFTQPMLWTEEEFRARGIPKRKISGIISHQILSIVLLPVPFVLFAVAALDLLL